jgi:VWFA-related protein
MNRRSLFLFGLLLLIWILSVGAAQKLAVDVNLTLLRAHVIDERGHAVLGLKAEDFELLENGKPIPISHFSMNTGAADIGLLVDTSLSTAPVREEINQTVGQLVAMMNGDRVFLMTFAGGSELVVPLTSDRAAVTKTLGKVKLTAGTRFYDAVLHALDELALARQDRKALIVLTDGADHFSAHTFDQLLTTARLYGCEIYIIGYAGDDSRTWKLAGRNSIRGEFFQLASVTGGQAIFPLRLEDSYRAARQVLDSLHHEYRFGFYSSHPFDEPSEVRIRIPGDRDDHRFVYFSLVPAPLP